MSKNKHGDLFNTSLTEIIIILFFVLMLFAIFNIDKVNKENIALGDEVDDLTFQKDSFKKIAVPRRLTIFLLFGVVLFFGLLLIYTYNVIVISSLLYLALIPLSILHFQNLNKKFVNKNIDNEEHEDIL